jgi:hypothetical protein
LEEPVYFHDQGTFDKLYADGVIYLSPLFAVLDHLWLLPRPVMSQKLYPCASQLLVA